MIDRFNDKKLFKAAFILGCFFFLSCENDEKIIEELTKNAKTIEEAKHIETYLSQGNRMRAKLVAPYMLRYQADTVYVEFTKSLHVDFFDTAGKTDSQLDAMYGKYYESLNKVYLRDSVVVSNVQGDTLRCPDLWWDQNSQKFYTDKRVRIKKGGNMFYGIGMEAKQDLSDIKIKKATGQFYVTDSLTAAE
ncbi:MAG: LPS export ABC transporter periplasmic protein LptC [Flavisolibacter sp.]